MDPTDLRAAVEGVIASYPELEIEEIAKRIVDDRPLVRSLDLSSVSDALAAIDADSHPKYEPPSTPYGLLKNVHPLEFPIKTFKLSKSLKALHHVQAGLGSLGVYLVQCDDDSVVALKQNSLDVCGELFACVFAREVLSSECVFVPRVQPLSFDSHLAMLAALRKVPVTIQGTCRDLFLPSSSRAGSFFMEFVPGEKFGSSAESSGGTLSEVTLKGMGQLSAVDVLTNNGDRFVIGNVWQNHGNGDNAHVLDDERIGAVDNGYSPIDESSDLHDGYLERVADVVALVRASGEMGEAFHAFVKKQRGIELDKQQSAIVSKAFLDTLEAVEEKHVVEAQRAVKDELSEAAFRKFRNTFDEGNFLRRVLKVCRRAAAS